MTCRRDSDADPLTASAGVRCLGRHGLASPRPPGVQVRALPWTQQPPSSQDLRLLPTHQLPLQMPRAVEPCSQRVSQPGWALKGEPLTKMLSKEAKDILTVF